MQKIYNFFRNKSEEIELKKISVKKIFATKDINIIYNEKIPNILSTNDLNIRSNVKVKVINV